ncbi:uncharacterized protein LOC130965751 isoform X1 [Arachis stenosperma]|uniref:uncharacterized protein LOC130965751 isoform X1 n=1 Tax=Arachis stenosperma TaxID=217475 RepID=UPI0025AB709D|nr:uncharacterized protein LOC130965751 isoform X1 [Arachis stenosperma]
MATSTTTSLFSLCSLLMAILFAYSASVQLNDPDWYFWFPLYSCACIVNLTNGVVSTKLRRKIGIITLCSGILLYLKVVLEDVVYGIAGFWSLDLSERVVREKIGSILVVMSMILQMEAFKVQTNNTLKTRVKEFSNMVKYGMLILVGFSYMLPLIFFVVLKGEMNKF